MSKIRLYGDTSGYVDLTAPAVADNRNIDLPGVLDSKLDLAGGKILQVVRATDTTNRTTTSTSLIDANISVTITPQKADSAIILIWQSFAAPTGSGYQQMQITDSSNNPISGSENLEVGAVTAINLASVIFAYATPATTSAVTYKGRYRITASPEIARIFNAATTGQLYAIEVSA